jgi:hypothetical protein
MWQIAEGASNSGQEFYFISNTEAGIAINDGRIWDRLYKICKNDENLTNEIFGYQVNGTRSSTIGDQLTLNDCISANLVKNAQGNVTIWAPNGDINTVLTDTELRYLLTNNDVTSINNISIDVFRNAYRETVGDLNFQFDDANALDQNSINNMFDNVKQVYQNDYFSHAVVGFDSEGRIIGVDTKNLLGGTSNHLLENAEYFMNVGEFISLPTDMEMSSKYQDYDSFHNLDKIKARQADYILRQLGIDTTNIELRDLVHEQSFHNIRMNHNTIKGNFSFGEITDYNVGVSRKFFGLYSDCNAHKNLFEPLGTRKMSDRLPFFLCVNSIIAKSNRNISQKTCEYT